MITDAHLHTTGREVTENVIQILDTAGIDVAVLLAPFLTPPYSLENRQSLVNGNRFLSSLIRSHPERLVGFAVVNPLHPEAASDLEEAFNLPGIWGLKLVPTGWYPYDDCAHRVYEVAARYGRPILFHSGIFIDGRSGRFCRPTFYEAVREYPNLRVTLAHLGWPWTNEAIAVGLIDRINGVPPEQCHFRFDISFGSPPIYRANVLRAALDVLGPELIQFGSDRFLPCSAEDLRHSIDVVDDLLSELNVEQAHRRMIMHETAQSWLFGRTVRHPLIQETV